MTWILEFGSIVDRHTGRNLPIEIKCVFSVYGQRATRSKTSNYFTILLSLIPSMRFSNPFAPASLTSNTITQMACAIHRRYCPPMRLPTFSHSCVNLALPIHFIWIFFQILLFNCAFLQGLIPTAAPSWGTIARN